MIRAVWATEISGLGQRSDIDVEGEPLQGAQQPLCVQRNAKIDSRWIYRSSATPEVFEEGFSGCFEAEAFSGC